MSESRFDEAMRAVAREYRVPADPPLEAMWEEIERAHWSRAGGASHRRGARRIVRAAPWLVAGIGMAATLMIGIAIGSRGVTSLPAPLSELERMRTTVESESAPYELATGRHLDQAAALLVALPSEAAVGGTSFALVEQAHDLLSTTRILLDSPAADNPDVRALLRDLELVLAQVSRMSTRDAEPGEVQLITDVILERDVLPRLRLVAAELPSNMGP
jgi:hypothetical protein